MDNFTQDQKNAIYTKGANILVSAAAGSGKTSVLTERIVRAVTDRVSRVDLDRMLVVTFTEQAAMEMKRRISGRLNEMHRADPDDMNIKRQISMLPYSNITTMHSFCRRIVSEHTEELDLDPRFKIGETAELLIIKQEVMERLLEEEYSKKNNGDFFALAEMYSGRYKDDSLRELIYETHEFIMTSPWPFKRAESFVRMYRRDNLGSIDGTVWAKPLTDIIKTRLEGLLFEFSYSVRLCQGEGGPYRYLACAESDISDIKILADILDNGLEAAFPVFSGFELSFARLPQIRKDSGVDPDLKDAVQKIRKDAKIEIKKIKNAFFKKPLNEYMQDLADLYPILKTLTELTKKFDALYRSEKHDRNLVDFNDLEQFAVKVLYTEDSDFDNHEISEAARNARDMFDEVATDEYQDTNYIQELILSAVSRSYNRFMVGDVKQSIYRFRQAKPEIFIEKYDRFSPFDKNEVGTQLKINLSVNYRSGENILKAINYLFCQLMSRDMGEIDYDAGNALNYPPGKNGSAEDDNSASSVDVYVIDKNTGNEDEDADETSVFELTKTEAEAAFIARKIKEMTGTEAGSRINYRDIVILSPSVKPIADVYAAEFKKLGIPLYINGSGRGYFKSLEVMTALDLLHIIDNPKQDIHMIGALHSSVYGFTCDELAQIRSVADGVSFYDCLARYEASGADVSLKEGIGRFLSELADLQKLAVFTPISELLWLLYEKTGLYEFSGAMEGGAVRQANLMTLIEWAGKYEQTRFKGMFHFLKYVEKLTASKNDLAEAKTVSRNENTVRLMTVHASKGLEFPVVFLSSLGRRFNTANLRRPILFDADYGFGPEYTNPVYRVKFNTVSRAVLAQKMLKEDLSEKLRVLYVALTRARKKLILTGVADYEKNRGKWERFINSADVKLPRHYTQKCGNFFEWIIPALLRQGKIKDLPYDGAVFTFRVIPPGDLDRAQDTGSSYEISDASADASVNEDIHKERQDIERLFSFKYPHESAETLPSKISISEIKRLHYLAMCGADSEPYYTDDIIFQEPEFISGQKTGAADIGTAVHTVMEHINFDTCREIGEIKAFADGLVRRNLIKAGDAAKIPLKSIRAFLLSDLCARIRKSPRVVREAPFVIALKPAEIYPGGEYKDLDEDILLHGIIDLFFEEDGKIILVDYKSDYIPAGQIKKITDKYLPQLAVYQKAVSVIEDLPVGGVYIYLFHANQAVKLEN